jgi:hypothetical protein
MRPSFQTGDDPYLYVQQLAAWQHQNRGRGRLQKGADGTFTLDLPPLEPGMYWMQYDYDAGVASWERTT